MELQTNEHLKAISPHGEVPEMQNALAICVHL